MWLSANILGENFKLIYTFLRYLYYAFVLLCYTISPYYADYGCFEREPGIH